ncbi:MAG: hypothetical protein KME15_26775 [Drouetiella hepatica Uher 2000/2452]|uniref:Uncharacterized protein n=1 Tax=Drouetiella hepatica Uher 2000/2452 TaxID=904376 RepID=A0A951US84_9CYAN|nr:hypothetical protein [Drouetiella hepatica Uher 2000/2452]
MGRPILPSIVSAPNPSPIPPSIVPVPSPNPILPVIVAPPVIVPTTLSGARGKKQFAIASPVSPNDQAIKLGRILVNKKLISPPQLESALIHQNYCDRKLGELLMEKNLISDEQLEQALREQYWRKNGYWVI